MNIADRIQHLRKIKGISQEELADKLGVSRQAVSKWESEQSIPDMDKVILMSDFFEVTTDYILKGIEAKKQTDKEGVNANMFVVVASALNFIGLIVASALWYEEQSPMAIVAGLIFMAVGCMIFGVGLANATQNVEKAKKLFWTVNIWLLAFIPLAVLHNALFSFALAPYPMLMYTRSLISVPMFGLVYLAVCLSVVFLSVKRGRAE